MLEECEVIQRLQVQQDVIQELRNMIEYQVSAKTHYIEENDLYLYHQIVFKEGLRENLKGLGKQAPTGHSFV